MANRVVHPTIPLFVDLSGKQIGINHPIGVQAARLQYPAEFLSVTPGLCIFNPNTGAIQANGILGLRFYHDVIGPDGVFIQGYSSNQTPIWRCTLDRDSLVPWKKTMDIFIELFTLDNSVLPQGSSAELTIQPFTEK